MHTTGVYNIYNILEKETGCINWNSGWKSEFSDWIYYDSSWNNWILTDMVNIFQFVHFEPEIFFSIIFLIDKILGLLEWTVVDTYKNGC